MTGPLDWSCETRSVPEGGSTASREASAAELAALSAALDVLSCDHLFVRYTLRPVRGDRFRLSGTLAADVTQACVVTLDPVKSGIDEPFDVEFLPAEQIEADDSEPEEVEILAGDDPEPIENGRIALGRIVYEHLAAALDPYPRAPGAALPDVVQAGGGADPAKESPFAVLARLKDKPPGSQ